MPIQIDISGHLPEVGFDEDAMRERLATLAEMTRAEWIRVAQQTLGSSAADYIAGIQPVEMDGNWAHIHLVGALPNDIENGKAPYDMKPGLLNGPNAKVGKGGKRFNTVPFRHGTPGTTGKRVGKPMPITGTTSGGKQKSMIYNAARKVAISSERPDGSTAWGGRTGDFGGYGIQTKPPVKGGRPGAYTWKHSPFAAMAKVAKTYKKATQHQYVTFRRVSDNSDPNSWWHPGIKARRLVNQVHSYITDLVKGII
ncbi:MAG: hypothetical protein JEZ11_24580 [Desulfobacterales bacterium]|nr:hypothetical protein [Desulfobacterales bacterium]